MDNNKEILELLTELIQATLDAHQYPCNIGDMRVCQECNGLYELLSKAKSMQKDIGATHDA